MKNRNILLLAFLVLISVGCAEHSGEKIRISVVSYNMRVGTANDGENSWEFRKGATAEMIKSLQPDLIGVQEAMKFQADYIAENCPEYGCYGVAREDGVAKGEHMSIFYKKEVFNLLDSHTFWLSETPDVPSKGWDASYKRTATIAFLEHKASGKKFYYVNTHLDHKGKLAQKNGLLLIVERIENINPDRLPLILSGDFNLASYEEPVLALNEHMLNTRSVAPVTDTLPTFNAWGKALKQAAIGENFKDMPTRDFIIDYIFYSPMDPTICLEYRTVTEQYASVPFISDHYPVWAVLEF